MAAKTPSVRVKQKALAILRIRLHHELEMRQMEVAREMKEIEMRKTELEHELRMLRLQRELGQLRSGNSVKVPMVQQNNCYTELGHDRASAEQEQPKESTSNGVGFLKEIKFIGFEFIVSKDNTEKTERVQLLNVKTDDVEDKKNGAGDFKEITVATVEEETQSDVPHSVEKTEQMKEEIFPENVTESPTEPERKEVEMKTDVNKYPESPVTPLSTESISKESEVDMKKKRDQNSSKSFEHLQKQLTEIEFEAKTLLIAESVDQRSLKATIDDIIEKEKKPKLTEKLEHVFEETDAKPTEVQLKDKELLHETASKQLKQNELGCGDAAMAKSYELLSDQERVKKQGEMFSRRSNEQLLHRTLIIQKKLNKPIVAGRCVIRRRLGICKK